MACAGALADPANLESGLPAEVADERTLPAGQSQVQLIGRFDRQRDDDRRLQLEPQLQYGLTGRLQGTVGLVGVFGSADRSGSGDVRLALQYRFVDEGPGVPGLAAILRTDLPTGRDSSGVDTALRLVASRTLGARPGEHRLHANAEWQRDASPGPGERADRWRAVLGWSSSLSRSTTLVADAVHEQLRERGRTATLAEFGARHELSKDWMLSVGAGLGGGSASAPRWRVVAGVERDL